VSIAPNQSCSRPRAALVALVAAACAFGASADGAAAGDARSALEQFLLAQTAGLPGRVTVSVAASAPAALPPCAVLQPFLPQGVAPWGRFPVGLRCTGERPWTRFVTAQVAVESAYLVAARVIPAGRGITADDVIERTGDLTRLPKSVLTDRAQLAGMVASNGLAPGDPLRKDLLRGATVVQQGQLVRLLARGDGFVAGTEGRAMTNAAAGGGLQVKTADGRLLAGVATADGQVVVPR
jgi:flagellar basal body P-ring formation protein FlgA